MGTVFQITPAGILTVIYSFNETEGYAPYAGLTLGTDCNFYGATLYGGTAGFGTAYRMTPSGSPTWLHNFAGGSDGLYPMAPPILAPDGNWYGTTQGDFYNNGTLYQLTPAGQITTLYTFIGPQGSDQPRAPLVLGTDGNLYGTTWIGGTNNQGMVFRSTLAGKLKVLFNFDSTHGAEPLSPLIQAADGNFYGTTSRGGSAGSGVAFKMTLAGKLSVFNDFTSGAGPSAPYAGLVQATDGYFYGTSYQGGAAGDGDIFRISAKGVLSPDLYDFDATTGLRPEVTLLQNTNGILYGDTYQGGTNISDGVFFSWNAGLKPFVSLLAPFSSGKIGDAIYVLGQGFTGTTDVSFDGVAATFTVVTDNYLTALVPTGAKTGSVTVKTPAGTLTSNILFRAMPVILSFSPPSGKVGTAVTIKGQSLSQTSKVTFNGKKATFTVDSDTQVTATVPTGAKTGVIVITTKGGTATSPGVFTVTQ